MSNLPPPVLTLEGVSFPVSVEGQIVGMGISLEALQDHFGALNSDPISAYRSHSFAIDSKGLTKYRAQPGVRVFLVSEDFS